MRIVQAVVTSAVLLCLAAPGHAATRGECELALKRLEESEPNVKPRFRAKFTQFRKRALEAQKREDWDGCAAASAEALTPGRPERPAATK